jgi:MSHA biogenesis protein MshQ
MIMIRLFLFACLAMLATGAQAVTYANKSIPFNWIDTSTHTHVGYNTVPYKMNGTIAPGTACGTTPPILDDTISDDIPFGFNFNYGGVVFTSARIMSNGRLQFNNNTACGYGSPVTQLPYAYYNSATNNLNYSMRIYGNDLDPTPQANAGYSTACKLTSTCYISYATIGTAPNRQFVVTWNNVPEWAAGGSTSGNYNLQIILNEADGSFIYQYGSDTPGPQAPLAQVGWQVSQTDYDVPNVGLPASNSAILFYIPSPIAQYHFQQSAWTAPGQVLDTSGSSPGYNGTALGGATPGVGYICNGAVIPNNTKTNTIDAIDTGISVPTVLGGVGTIDFWYNSNAAWVGGGDAQLLDASISQNQWFFVVKLNNGDVRFVITDSNGTYQVVQTGAYNFAAGSWTHIAVTWNFNALAGSNQDRMSVYINGTQVKLQTFTTSGTVSSSIGTLYLGDNRSSHTGSNGTGNSANGTLDEVNIYNYEGTPALVQRDMSYTSSCGSVDHLVIQSSGNGLTCGSNTLTVTACQDAACTTPFLGGESGTLGASGTPVVNWDGSTGGSTGSGFVIPAGSSSVTKDMQVASAGMVTFGVSTATPLPANPTTCNFGTNAPANNNCVFTASTAGFIFSNTSTGNTLTIPPMISGLINIDIGQPNATPLYLRAVQASTSNPAVCTPAIISQTTSVNMGYTCNNPATCQAGNLAAINATAIAPGAPGSTPVSLSFDANGSAPVTARYDDVGQITLNANKTATPFGGSSPVTLSGSSNAFVVAPHHFGINFTAGPIKAGNNFSATVTAYNGLAMPTATGNFGKETVPESVTLSFSKCQPTGTNSSNGTFSGSVGPFAGGVANSTNLNWNEIGNGDLVATLASGSYLGSGLTATGNTGTNGTVCNGGGAGNVGRFIPDHFDTVISGGMACPTGLACPATFNGIVYSGQPFTINVNAYAKNALWPNTLKNYDGTSNTNPNFAKPVTLTAWDALGSTTTNNPPTASGSSLVYNPIVAAAFSQGTTTLGTPAAPVYTFGTTPTAPTDIYIRAADVDATSLRIPASSSVEGGIKVVSGRVTISNAYGSELLPLPITSTLQYWNGAGWATSTTDNITQFNTNLSTSGGNIVASIINGLGSGISVATPGVVTVAAGVKTFTLNKPGVAGSADISLNAPGYLLGGSNAAAINPSHPGRATFGVYKGADELIYQHENY